MSADDVFGIVGTVQGGAFRVDEVVAEGGFAVVYRAYHGAFRSNVALKCLKIPRTLSESEQKEFLEKFREEAELLFRLSSAIPSVVRPLHVGTLAHTKGRFVPFIALEWLDGLTLSTLVSNRAIAGKPPLELVAVVKILTPVADALCHAHKFPTPSGPVAIVHRDLKPENVFIANMHGKEMTKVLDFGIAKVKSATNQMVGRQSATESPMSAFTPAYGAPEQWIPKSYGQTGPWTDVWGLALTAVEALCGHAPIDGEVGAMMGAALNPGRRPTPRNEGVKVPDDVEAVFTQALAVDPRERFHDVGAFWNALCRAAGLPQSVGDQSPSLVPPPTPMVPSGPEPRSVGNVPVPDLIVSSAPPASRASKAPVPVVVEARRMSRPAAPAQPASRRQADPNEMFGGNVLESLDGRRPGASASDRCHVSLGKRPGRRRADDGPAYVWRATKALPGRLRPREARPRGAPSSFFGFAVVLMGGDYVYASFTGEVLRLGRPGSSGSPDR